MDNWNIWDIDEFETDENFGNNAKLYELFKQGYGYYKGIGYNEDVKKAVDLLYKAAESGLVIAEYTLGHVLGYTSLSNYNGSGIGITSRNQAKIKSTEYFKRAALKGHIGAQYEYSLALLTGKGCEKNLSESYRWLKHAADTVDMDKYKKMLKEYEYCKLPKKDMEVFEKALISKPQYSLGERYRSGDYFEKNPELAVKYYKNAAENGNPMALFAMGCAYRYGWGVGFHMGKSDNYFQRLREYDTENCFNQDVWWDL